MKIIRIIDTYTEYNFTSCHSKKVEFFKLIHALPWAYNYYNRYMPKTALLIKTYPGDLKLIEFKLRNFLS